MKTNWLDRRISAPGPYLCLCLSEQEYRNAMHELGVEFPAQFINQNADATTHYLTAKQGLTVVVCLGDTSTRNGIEIAGLLIHEAVHAWQAWCREYGEEHPGEEQEAYAIQAIAQELMAEYERRTKK